MTVEKLTEQRDGQNVIALRQDGKRRWAIASAGMGEKSTRFLYGEYADKLAEYESIGTPDKCRAAVEKQAPKKIVRVKLRQSEWGSEYRCPVCESDLIKTVFFNEDGTEPDEKISWCSGCGQKLDWSDEE